MADFLQKDIVVQAGKKGTGFPPPADEQELLLQECSTCGVALCLHAVGAGWWYTHFKAIYRPQFKSLVQILEGISRSFQIQFLHLYMSWGSGRVEVQNPITQGMTQLANYDMALCSTLTLPKYWWNHQCLLVPSIPSTPSSWKTNCAAFSEPKIFDKCLWIKF